MRRPAKLSLFTGASYFSFSIAVWYLLRLLGLSGSDLWILRGGLWFLGGAAAGLILWYLLKARKGKGEKDAPDEIEAAIASAKKRIAKARPGGIKSLNDLPMIFFLGESGSAKTSVVTQSGLDPDLLAGQVHQGDAIVPTGAVNIWYANQAVFVEVGGMMLKDADRLSRLVKLLRPRRLKAAVTGRALPPRIAVVCVGSDELQGMRATAGAGAAGGSGGAGASALTLQDAIRRIASGLGTRVPVYALFTKTDLVPRFTDFVRNLTADEVATALGATLRIPTAGATGVYAEKESERLSAASNGVFNSLAMKRLDLLSREANLEERSGAYEFPRELLKIFPALTQYLIELCRPTDLDVSPVLRGFYFTGVRPVIVGQQPKITTPQTRAAAASGAVAATMLFDPGEGDVRLQPEASPTVQRRVPQWVFLQRLFSDVLLEDRVARSISAGGIRVSRLRRVGLATASALGALLLFGFLVSFINNVRLNRRTLAAAQGIERLGSFEPELPPLDALERLEAARVQAELLGRYEERGAPWRLGWGLYTGSSLYPQIRRLYFARLEQVLLDPARTSMLSALGRVDTQSEFRSTYDLLKTYLMTTTYTDSIQQDFLVPRLRDWWLNGRNADEERAGLAERQFSTYAGWLCRDHDCSIPSDELVVVQTRQALLQSSTADRAYQEIISIAANVRPIQFSVLFPGSETTIANTRIVPGAFTEEGWALINDRLGRIGESFSSEEWVLGERVASEQDLVRLAGEVRSMYLDEYVRNWREYLEETRIARSRSASDAARKLANLRQAQSPLLQMFALVSQNTDEVDSITVGRAFQPLHTVTPRDSTNDLTQAYVGESNTAYMSGLANLFVSVENVVNNSGEAAEAAKTEARSNAAAAKVAVAQLAQQFDPHPDAVAVGRVVEALMRVPIENTERWLAPVRVAARDEGSTVNRRAAGLCNSMRPMLAKFPFNSDATEEASLEEVAQMLQPDNSALWNFFNEVLTEVLEEQGGQYVAREDVPVTTQFLTFFNQAIAVSRAIWQDRSTEPQFRFTFRPRQYDQITGVELSVDGRTQVFSPESRGTGTFVWEGNRARDVRLTISSGGASRVLSHTGTWAIFHLFRRANWGEPTGGRYIVLLEIDADGGLLETEVSLPGVPILNSTNLSSLRCEPQVLSR
jgi:type VI secretion system protein ImpL